MPRVPSIPATEQAPFDLPLTRKGFRVALRRGHGRALLHAQQYGLDESPGFLDELLAAALKCPVLDPQSEGLRADWLLELATLSGVKREFASRFQAELAGERLYAGDDWSLVLRCELFGLFAQEDECWARLELERMFGPPGTIPPKDWLFGLPPAAEQLLDLDGEEGLLRVAERLGERLERSPEEWVDKALLWYFDQDREAGSALAVLEEARKQSARVNRFLLALETKRAEPGRVVSSAHPNGLRLPLERNSAADVIAYVGSPKHASCGDAARPFHGHFLHRWGMAASQSSLSEVYERLAAATIPSHLYAYLRVFAKAQLPVLSPAVLDLARHEDPLVRIAAVTALSQLRDTRLRDLALDSLEELPANSAALALFHLNAAPGDAKLVSEALRVPRDIHDLHGLVGDLLFGFQTSHDPDTSVLMLFIYEHSPCSECRRKAVRQLADSGPLPTWLAEEIAFDSNADTRAVLITPHT